MPVNTKCAHCSADLLPAEIKEGKILCHTCLMIWDQDVKPAIYKQIAKIVESSTPKFRPDVVLKTYFYSQ